MMQVNAGLDEGDILSYYSLPIQSTDTTASLTDKLSQLSASVIGQTVSDYVNGTVAARPQSAQGVSYTKPLTSEDGHIDLNNPPAHLDRLIRAFWPWPGVWGLWQGQRIKLLPGGQVQMAGKKPVSLADFLRGHQDFPIKSLR
jgi:methionyl-tRNA formyltransferase